MADDRTPLWLDCDPGHDDALAIVLAAYHPKSRLIGVSTVASNHTLGRVTANAAAVLAAAGLGSIPLVKGAARPLFSPPLVCPAIHGASGLDLRPGTAFADVVAAAGAPFPSADPGPAPLAMAAAITAAHAALNAGTPPGTLPRRVALVATGALTNVAMLLWLFPHVAGLVDLSVMGGAHGPGNTHPCAEFNFAVDPHAGAAVFGAAGLVDEGGGKAGQPPPSSSSPHRAPTTLTTAAAAAPGDEGDDPPPLPVSLCPLEVTHTALVTPHALERMGLAESGAENGRGHPTTSSLSPFRAAVRDVLLFFHASYAATFEGFTAGPPLHDPCAVLLALEPEAFSIKAAVRVDVETASPLSAGQTVIDGSGLTGRPPNARLAVGVDVERLWGVLGDAIAAADARSPLNR